jgi:hypothetical protein
MPDTITLCEFLERSGAEVRLYDVGRRIGELDRARFLAFEMATAPYPLPMQRKAWVALVQSDKANPADPVIWFLRLGLDEQGLLVQAERDYLLNRLFESAQNRSRSEGRTDTDFLQDNPYSFSPREDRMALFHARLSADLGLPPSRFYTHALDYFGGQPGWDQWGFVGYQGIADVACRHAAEPLVTAIPHLPDEPLIALCHCLESQAIAEALERALNDRLAQAMAEPSTPAALTAALVRGLSSATRHASVRQQLKTLLARPLSANIEILAALSGRAWETLEDRELLDAFLARLARNDHGQAAFEQCLGDLLSLPALAPRIREALRSPEQAVGVREAFGRMTQVDHPTPDN